MLILPFAGKYSLMFNIAISFRPFSYMQSFFYNLRSGALFFGTKVGGSAGGKKERVIYLFDKPPAEGPESGLYSDWS